MKSILNNYNNNYSNYYWLDQYAHKTTNTYTAVPSITTPSTGTVTYTYEPSTVTYTYEPIAAYDPWYKPTVDIGDLLKDINSGKIAADDTAVPITKYEVLVGDVVLTNMGLLYVSYINIQTHEFSGIHTSGRCYVCGYEVIQDVVKNIYAEEDISANSIKFTIELASEIISGDYICI